MGHHVQFCSVEGLALHQVQNWLPLLRFSGFTWSPCLAAAIALLWYARALERSRQGPCIRGRHCPASDRGAALLLSGSPPWTMKPRINRWKSRLS